MVGGRVPAHARIQRSYGSFDSAVGTVRARGLRAGAVGSLLIVLAAGCVPTTALDTSFGAAGTMPGSAAPAIVTTEPVADGFELPVAIRALGDGSERLLIVQQRGLIRALDPRTGQIQSEPVLDLSDDVSCCGEQGLLDAAPHPHVAQNGWVFVSYTDLDGATTVARFELDGHAATLRLDPATRRTVIAVPQPGTTHNGGGLAFAPDGMLFVGVGDGHFAFVARRSARRVDTLLGSLLRIDVSDLPYRVPHDNPLLEVEGARPEIWAYGLRNPWRFAFDDETGRLFVADVGQFDVEEINVVPLAPGAAPDFGWPAMEGPTCREHCAGGTLGTLPVLSYDHRHGCSVIGGAVYRGAAVPDLAGAYLFGDFCRGTVWAATEAAGTWQARTLIETGAAISTFGVDADGEIYVADYGRGQIRRLAPATP